MADIFEQCSTSFCRQARTCVKKLEPDSLNIRVQKWKPTESRGKFHCVGYEKIHWKQR